jgi:PAS domain S-box-containing protein
MSNVSHLTPQDLQSAIARNFLTITSDQSVRSAIAMMGETGESCVLVVQCSESDYPDLASHDLLGIVTERDIIHVSLQSIPLEQISVITVMSQPVITISEARIDDLQAVMQLFQQQHIQHLPVLDGDRVVGMLYKNRLTDILSQSFLDNKEIRKIEASRQASDLQSSILATAAPVAIFKFDEIFHCTYVNDRWSEMTGRPKESALGNGWMDSLHPDDRDALLAQWSQDYTQSNLNDRVIVHSEGRHLRPDGSTNWFYVQVVQEIDSDNNVVGYVGTLTDITSRKQAEIALQKSEQRYRALMDGASDAIFLSDIHGYGITANQQAEILLGYSREEIKNLHMSLIHPPESLEAVRAHFTQIVQNESATNLETLVVRKDGSLIPVDITARIIELEDEQVVQAIFRDIRARKNIEEELAKSEAKFRRLVEGANDLIWSADQDGVFTYLSPQFKDLFGWEPSEWIGKSMIGLVHSEDLPSLCDYIQNAKAGQKSNKAEFRHLHHNGSYIWVKVNTTSIVNSEGSIIGYQGVLTDISDRKNSEESLRVSEEMFRSAFNNTAIGMSLVSPEGRFIEVNAAICNLFGYSESELLQLTFLDITHPDDQHQSMELAKKLIRGEIQNDSFEKRYYNKQGQVVWGLVSVSIVRDSHEQPLYLVAQIQDISDRKQAEIQLQNISTRLDVALDAARIGIWEWDIVTSELIWDERMYEFYGVNPAEKITAEAWMNSIHPEDISNALEDSRQALAGAKEYNSEFRVLLSDGSSRYLQSHAIVQRDDSDNPLRMIGVNYDITQQKQAELKLRESEIRFRRVFESSVVGMLFADFQGHILEANDRFLEMIGYTREELLSGAIHWDDITPPEHVANDLIAIEQLQQHGVINPWEKEYYRKDGSRVAVLIGAALLPDTSDQTICIVMDISDRKEAEKILAQYTSEVEDLYNNAPCGYHSLDPNGRYIRVNETELQWLGYQREEMIGQPLIKFLTEDSCQAFFSNYQVFLEQGTIKNVEFDIICKDGSILPAMISSTAVKDEHGNYLYGRTTMVDIRDRKQSELALRESQRFIQRIADASPNILYLYDIQEHRNVYANREIFTTLGYSSAEIQAMGENFIQQLLHPDDLKVSPPNYYERIQTAKDGEVIETEYRMRHANGEWRWLFSRDSVFSRDADGRVRQTIGTAQDITEWKQLQQKQNRLISILEASTDYISMIDANGNVFWKNAQLKKLCGIDLNAEEVMQFKISDCHPQWATDLIVQEGFPAAIATGSWLGETALLDAKGQETPVSQLILSHKSPQGEVEFFSFIMRDMQVQKEYEQRLEKTNAELMRATQLKNEFLATMSHELRTPLNAILGMTESLKEQIFGTVNERQLQALQTVERSGLHLLELINDVLDVAKIEAGQIELNYTPTSITYLCQSSLAFIRQQANHKNIKINVQIPTLCSDILVDERRIRQVLINLLNNAVKFTPDGGQVTLAVRRTENQEGSKPASWIQFSVSDTGIGISSDKIPKLFQPFVQIDSSLNRKYAGTGLGLALVKRLVELHGGKVHLTSEVDVGSCFDIFIPYIPELSNTKLADEATQPEIYFESNGGSQPEIDSETITETLAIAPTSSPTILIVEDNEANINTLANYLEAKGYQLLLARDGLAAITMATDQHPDLILMDIQMPVMDGLESTKQIRRNPELVNIPIIALTALAMPNDREKCIEAGANDYITKPVKLKQLYTLIQQLLT